MQNVPYALLIPGGIHFKAYTPLFFENREGVEKKVFAQLALVRTRKIIRSICAGGQYFEQKCKNYHKGHSQSILALHLIRILL